VERSVVSPVLSVSVISDTHLERIGRRGRGRQHDRRRQRRAAAASRSHLVLH
jgi:hypothetical protein